MPSMCNAWHCKCTDRIDSKYRCKNDHKWATKSKCGLSSKVILKLCVKDLLGSLAVSLGHLVVKVSKHIEYNLLFY